MLYSRNLVGVSELLFVTGQLPSEKAPRAPEEYTNYSLETTVVYETTVVTFLVARWTHGAKCSRGSPKIARHFVDFVSAASRTSRLVIPTQPSFQTHAAPCSPSSRPPPASRPCRWRARRPRRCSRPAPCVARTTPRRCPLWDRSASSTRLVSTRATHRPQRTTHQHHAYAPRTKLTLTGPTHHAPRGA